MLIYANPAEQFKSYQSEIESAVLSVMRGNSYILGKEVSAFEKEFATYIGTNSAIGVANGTDAIEIALRALDVGKGDEVITVSHTHACANTYTYACMRKCAHTHTHACENVHACMRTLFTTDLLVGGIRILARGRALWRP